MEANQSTFQEAVYEHFARIGKAVSSPKRLQVLELLCQGPRTVELLAREAGLSVANTSRHLQVLRSARLVETEKQGVFVRYRMADQAVCDFFRAMRLLAEKRLAEVEQIKQLFFRDKEGMEPVDQQELLSRVRSSQVTVLDVRPTEEYLAGHIPGAISIPLKELKRRLSELPKQRQIVAYCRGPYCVLALKAVELLRRKGFQAVRLEDGVQDWRARGFPVAVGHEGARTWQGSSALRKSSHRRTGRGNPW